MIPVFLWGWSNTCRTSSLRRQLATLQPEGRFKMPIICEIPEQTLQTLVMKIQTKIMESKGRPNVHVIFLHPNFRMLQIESVKENFQCLMAAAAFNSKTFIIFCDATGSYPDNGSTLVSPYQVNTELRRLTTQWPLNSLYLDLHLVLVTNDWTRKFNLRPPGQVKLGQAITRALSGTPPEVFQYG
jgi:hypothetical protein